MQIFSIFLLHNVFIPHYICCFQLLRSLGVLKGTFAVSYCTSFMTTQVLFHTILILNIILVFSFVFMSVLPILFICVMCVQCHKGQKRPLELLKLELQMLVFCYVSARNQSRVLWKSNQCYLSQAHLSSPQCKFLFQFQGQLRAQNMIRILYCTASILW